MTPSRQVLICQNRTCHQQGADAVVQGFQRELPEDVVLEVRQCLGQCGNGPMVLVLPDQVWYSHVQPRDVPRIIEQHLRRGTPVKEKLYQEFHPHQEPKPFVSLVWLMVIVTVLAVVGLLGWGIYWVESAPQLTHL